jgi:RNA polymerase sigma-70 factor (ECF subfamily)
VGYESEAFYRRHYKDILGFVRRRSSRDEADDLAQMVFADAAAALARSAELAPPSLALLYTIARRRLADRTRRHAREPAAVPFDEGHVEQAEPAYESGLAAGLRAGLLRLPEEQRTVVVMRLLHGVSFREIAKAVGVDEAACKMRFYRGLGGLREQLEQEGITP